MKSLKVIRERILNGEQFTFPDAYWDYDINNNKPSDDISLRGSWFEYKPNDDEWDIPRIVNSNVFSTTLHITSFGNIRMVANKYILTKKVKFVIELKDVIFKSDYDNKLKNK